MTEQEYLKASEEGSITDVERIALIPKLLEWWLGEYRLNDYVEMDEDETERFITYLNNFIISPYYHPCFGTIEKIDTYEGYDGGQENTQQVVKFVELDLYFKREGNYQSYDGCTWDSEWSSTYPTPVTYIEYP